MCKSEVGNRAILRRISDALGVPVERFTVDQEPTKNAIDDDFLFLWSKIVTEEGKQQAIKALQAIVQMERR